MKNSVKRFLGLCLLIMFAVIVLFVSGCGSSSPPPLEATGGAIQVTSFGFDIPKNSQGRTTEQQNIIDRLAVTTSPVKVLWIHLISLDGKIIQRMPVAQKVTSSGKRLEPITAASTPYQAYANYPAFKGADGKTYQTTEFMQPDGTFGQSDSYIYWFDTQHRYHQWGTAGGLGYFLTDYPIDLRNPQDLVSGMYNADKMALEWQKLQEAQMLAREVEACKQMGKIFDQQKGECQDVTQ